jgi:hypothetical protein
MSGDLSRLLRSMIWGWLDPTAMAGPHFVVESLCPLHECDETNVVIGDPVGLTRLLLLVIRNIDRLMVKHVDCCVDAVWIVALKAATCFKTRFWALFEAKKASREPLDAELL